MSEYCLKVLSFCASSYSNGEIFQNFRVLSPDGQVSKAIGYFQFKGTQICFKEPVNVTSSNYLFFRARDIVRFESVQSTASEAARLIRYWQDSFPEFQIVGEVTAAQRVNGYFVLTVNDSIRVELQGAVELPFQPPLGLVTMSKPRKTLFNKPIHIQFVTKQMLELLHEQMQDMGYTPSYRFIYAFSQFKKPATQLLEFQIASFAFPNLGGFMRQIVFFDDYLILLQAKEKLQIGDYKNVFTANFANSEYKVIHVYNSKFKCYKALSYQYADHYIKRMASKLGYECFIGTITNVYSKENALEVLVMTPSLQNRKIVVENVGAFSIPRGGARRFFLILLAENPTSDTIGGAAHCAYILTLQDAEILAKALKLDARIVNATLVITGYPDRYLYKVLAINPPNSYHMWQFKVASSTGTFAKILIGERLVQNRICGSLTCCLPPTSNIYISSNCFLAFGDYYPTDYELQLYINSLGNYLTAEDFYGTVLGSSAVYDNMEQINLLIQTTEGQRKRLCLRNCIDFPSDQRLVAVVVDKSLTQAAIIHNIPAKIQFMTLEVALRISQRMNLGFVEQNKALHREESHATAVPQKNIYIKPLTVEPPPHFSKQIEVPGFKPLRIVCDFHIPRLCMGLRYGVLIVGLPKAYNDSYFIKLYYCALQYGECADLYAYEIAVLPHGVVKDFVAQFFKALQEEEMKATFDIFGMLCQRPISVRLNFGFARVTVDCTKTGGYICIGRMIFSAASGYTRD